MHPRRIVSVALFALSALPAQDAAALAAREAESTRQAVADLNALAGALQAQKQYGRAFELRRELLLEYDADDPTARAACGFERLGDGWRPDESVLVLQRDLRGDPRALQKIDRDLAALERELVREHRALAEGWSRLGDAARHWRRVLRWAPEDRAALAALSLGTFEGFRGDERQMALLRRARAIRGAVDWLGRRTFATTPLTGEAHPLLLAIGLPHTGVASQHFRFWGSLPEDQLVDLAQHAERAWWLVHTLFGTSTGEVFRPRAHRDFLFVHTNEAYGAVLDQCAAQFGPERLQFLKRADLHQSFVQHGGSSWRFHRAVQGHDVDLDQTVRAVVQDASGIATDGLYEGIGHAACGLVFGRTLTFLLEQQTQRTSASSATTLLAPDLETWRRIAEQSAWGRSDTRSSELVLLSAARFTNEQRVKAWAIADYLLHWRPDWLLELDRCRSEAVRTPPEVEAEFLRRTGCELVRLDAEWREFWARERELRAAMARDPLAGGKDSDRPARLRARSLVDAVDEVRLAAGRGPVGFHLADDPDTRAVLEYARALAKAEARRRKKPEQDVPLPEPPAALGRTVFWSRAAEPAEAVAEWMASPARRDALLHPGRGLCGAAVGDSWVLDVGEPALPTRTGVPFCWPADGQDGVDGSAAVADIGARAAAALGDGALPDRVGMPLSLHFARAVPAESLAEVHCRVLDGGAPVDGAVVCYAADVGAFEPVDGVVAFVPRQPLPAGRRIEVQWELPAGLLPPETTFPAVTFTVR